MNKQNHYGIKWPHSIYENNTAARNITANVRKHLTTGHQGGKLAVYIPPFPTGLSFPNTPPSQVSEAFYWNSFTGPFQCELPESEWGTGPVDYSVPSLPHGHRCHQDKMGQMSTQASKWSAFFPNLCWNQRLTYSDLGQDWHSGI